VISARLVAQNIALSATDHAEIAVHNDSVSELEGGAFRPVTPAHRLRRMAGRDPYEVHRVATPLELLFDLTFVIGFGVTASEFAHALSENQVGPGLAGFAFATFSVVWAWINFTWFASAYDTDDWVYRLTTMLQMVGVIILSLGIAPMFASIEHGEHVDNQVLVAGYIVMRIAMVFQWLRAASQDPARRSACLTYAAAITIGQLGWVAVLFVHTSVPVTFLLVVVLVGVEMSGPWIAERRHGGTPWHAHHIAERYSLLVIIALGEGVVGTVASLNAVLGEQGWTMDAVLVAVAGIGLTFGMWWVYFVVPSAPLLHVHRERSFRWGYGHIPLFGAIVATGAGLHAAAYFIEGHSKLGSVETVLAVALPIAVYIVGIFGLYLILVRSFDAFHLLLLAGSGVVLGAAVALAAAGVTMAVCLVVVMLAPVVIVVGFEVVGHRHAEQALSREL
jgi:low temperature requirement protein LtrA